MCNSCDIPAGPFVQIGDDVLRKKARSVVDAEFGGNELQQILDAMFKALATSKDGVALAAPQIGISKSIFIIAPHIAKEFDAEEIYINPQIIKRSSKKTWMDEGCLSVRWKYGQTYRNTNVIIKAQKPDGTFFERGAGKLLAQIYQHEYDHLQGVLFVDHARDVREYHVEN